MEKDCFKNLNRIEFVITYACTGNCKHCSEGDHQKDGEYIDRRKAVELINTIAKQYNIKSLMTFGGEPLLHPNIVCAIHSAARAMNIPKRQLITNGYFSKEENKIKQVANDLVQSGVNDILVSVDAFHQETIPLELVMKFVKELQALKTRIRMQPAWLVDKSHNNPYNNKTKDILEMFKGEGIEENDGNIILPSGNARKYLSEYYDLSKEYKSPYTVNPYDVDTISINPDGKFLNGNIYHQSILEIMDGYQKSL